ncbi:hypothetical protein [Bradyrhizobium ganzhouense]
MSSIQRHEDRYGFHPFHGKQFVVSLALGLAAIFAHVLVVFLS